MSNQRLCATMWTEAEYRVFSTLSLSLTLDKLSFLQVLCRQDLAPHLRADNEYRLLSMNCI